MSFIIAGTAIAGIGAGYNIISGANKTAAGNRLAAGNKRPWYNIPSEYAQNVGLTGAQAETGLPESTVNYYTTQAARGLSSGTDAILQGGGDANSLSRLYDEFSQGLSKESAEDAQLKSQHLNAFINANKDEAGQKTQQWALNYYEPYKDTAQLASALKTGGQQQVGTGIGEAVGAASSFANQELYKPQSGKIGTMGDFTNSPQIPTGEGGSTSYVPPTTLSDNANFFDTPGGSAVMGRIQKGSPGSSEFDQLYQLINQRKI